MIGIPYFGKQPLLYGLKHLLQTENQHSILKQEKKKEKKGIWIVSVMATKVDEEAGVNGAGGTIKEEKIPLLKAQEFLDIEN